jgi:hypothetical protein
VKSPFVLLLSSIQSQRRRAGMLTQSSSLFQVQREAQALAPHQARVLSRGYPGRLLRGEAISGCFSVYLS